MRELLASLNPRALVLQVQNAEAMMPFKPERLVRAESGSVWVGVAPLGVRHMTG